MNLAFPCRGALSLWALAIALGLALAPGRLFAETPAEAQVRALGRANAAVVGLRATAVEDARSSESLGPVRQGSGVVIGPDGLVLTIGYLILEADRVELLLDSDRVMPARVIAYDQATGFGLVRALAPLKLPVAALGDAGALGEGEVLMVASGGQDGAVSVARVLSRRPFSGYWEYHIDGALFTAPARADHSGAGLFNGRGELVGIGSLIVMEAAGPERRRTPANMFVPIDLLKPILGELQQLGASSRSRRAWLGVNCVERDGEVRVLRVAAESPAEAGGVQAGDHIVGIDGLPVSALQAFYEALWTGETERRVVLEVRRGSVLQTLTLRSLDRSSILRRPRGI